MADPSPQAGATPAPTDVGEALREIAARAAAQLGGRVLLFAAADAADKEPKLRAAAGFASAEEARDLAEDLGPPVSEVHAGSPGAASAPDGSALCLLPLAWDERRHGVLAVATGEPLAPAARESFQSLAEQAALRLDHADARTRLARTPTGEATTEADPDELLKLSEALFHQDIELLQNRERLGKIEKLKNDFIEKMSRELRTPLNSIIESIITVLAGENENLSETARQSLRTALDDGSAFLRTLQNILDLWRIKQNELPAEVQTVNFREVVDEAIFSVQDTLGDKPLKIEKELVEPLPKIRTDLAKVNQILFLLLENAVKFTLEGGIQIRVEIANGNLTCAIRDTGIGICPDDRQFIFDEFYQVDEVATSGYRGAGLGLALVRDLVTLLDGELEVLSEVGRGSTFSFRVPVEVLG